ncbi:MAG: 4a-hydroxytetrahydrobiopterin dehydratase [Proteobacteria bacterium]|nr:MAG: 4a-hydroxytetrahydrobiopterin dehydratase [Pseudomonadota bacterium]
MRPNKLSAEQAAENLKNFPGWELKDGKLHIEIKFNNFQQAFSFMTQAALVSEKMDHHPEWFNVYNRVIIDLSTHSCGGISELDFEWAKSINAILGR